MVFNDTGTIATEYPILVNNSFVAHPFFNHFLHLFFLESKPVLTLACVGQRLLELREWFAVPQ